jgi:hypothetical protein
MFGISLLTVGFILHLLLRAFWLALVCINYANRNGILQIKSTGNVHLCIMHRKEKMCIVLS